MDTNERCSTIFGKDPITFVDKVNTTNETNDKNEELLQDFKRMIVALLHPKGDERLKFAKKEPRNKLKTSESLTPFTLQQNETSAASEEENLLMEYPNLQRNIVWGVGDVTQLQLKKDFLPSTPSWWIKNSCALTPTTSSSLTKASDTSTNVLMDGAVGWSAFLV